MDKLILKKSENDSGFSFKIMPRIDINGGNKIIRRTINKGAKGGTIKERWSLTDHKINISGVLISNNGSYPENTVKSLLAYLQYPKDLIVINERLNARCINRIAIENYSIPFTNGIANQSYSFTAYSDELFDKLLAE